MVWGSADSLNVQQSVHLPSKADMKLDPWSIRIASGTPTRAKTDISSLAIRPASVLGRGMASG